MYGVSTPCTCYALKFAWCQLSRSRNSSVQVCIVIDLVYIGEQDSVWDIPNVSAKCTVNSPQVIDQINKERHIITPTADPWLATCVLMSLHHLHTVYIHAHDYTYIYILQSKLALHNESNSQMQMSTLNKLHWQLTITFNFYRTHKLKPGNEGVLESLP